MTAPPGQERRAAGHRSLGWSWRGPDTVLLHGFTGTPESWSSVVARLLARRGPGRGRLVALALPGHDAALAVDRRGGFAGARDRAERALDALGLGLVRIAGYSMGARLALGMVVARPERYARAILVAARPGLRDADERRARAARERRWIDDLRTRGTEHFMDAWERLPLFATQERLDRRVLRAQAQMRRGHHAWRLAAALETLGLAAMPDLHPALGACTTPCALVAGGEDGRFAVHARELAAALPHGTATIVPGAGHNLLIEAPDAVAGRIEEGIDDE